MSYGESLRSRLLLIEDPLERLRQHDALCYTEEAHETAECTPPPSNPQGREYVPNERRLNGHLRCQHRHAGFQCRHSFGHRGKCWNGDFYFIPTM